MTSVNRGYPKIVEYSLKYKEGNGCGGAFHFIDHNKKIDCEVRHNINDSLLFSRARSSYSPVAVDLLEIANAIYLADRLSCHLLHKNSRRINLHLSVRCPELFDENIKQKLQELLSWATHTTWVFDFVERTTPIREIELRSSLFPSALEGRLTLWSGGLDALAGVYNQLRTDFTTPVRLIGLGGNNEMLCIQKKLAHELQDIFGKRRVLLQQLPFHSEYPSTIAHNKLLRSRGIVFMLIGCAVAYLSNNQRLYLYENGPGAINLPYTRCEVGLDHTRSTHPCTLAMLSDLISALFKDFFIIENPVFFFTKSEMMSALTEDNRADLSHISFSCDSPHRSTQHQCGYCSSCLLRRQSILAAGMIDHTHYVITHGNSRCKDSSKPLQAIQDQISNIERLIGYTSDTTTTNRWEAFSGEYPDLDDVADIMTSCVQISRVEVIERILSMYNKYTEEWKRVNKQLEIGIFD